MSGQFPDRIANSGVFGDTANTGGLGGAGFTRYTMMASEAVVAAAPVTVTQSFSEPLPGQPGGVATFEVELNAWQSVSGGTAGAAPVLLVDVALVPSSGSPAFYQKAFNLAGSDLGVGNQFSRSLVMTLENLVEEYTGLSIRYTINDPGSLTMTFPAGQTEFVVKRIG